MTSKKRFSLAAIVVGCSAFAAGTTVAFGAANPSASAAPSDEQISQMVLHKITKDMPDSLQSLQVQTTDGVVTLSGHADSGVVAQKALEDARRVQGVTDVKDHLRVVM